MFLNTYCLSVYKSLPVYNISFFDDCCDLTAAKHLAQWWTRVTHLKMLSNIFSLEPESWVNCPASTYAVERKNQDCKTYGPIKFAMINVFQVDKNVCYKHIAANMDQVFHTNVNIRK